MKSLSHGNGRKQPAMLLIPFILFPLILPAQPLFDLLLPAQTGVDFVNRIEENSEQDNVLAYEYFYNGGGVAAGDLNNDGLPDLYFTSNRESNRLYLNLGGLKFRDITKTAGVGGRRNGWKTGVTFADVNADGWIDIYVCYSGRGNDDARRNQLFINNKNLSFTEKAREYGLDDPGYGTQAAFFDYDSDGDLDCFILNHNIKEYRNFENDEIRKTRDPLAGDKLLENRNGRFVDVSERAGIPANPLGFGLGVAVSDINQDGWPDIYVSNDYNEPDYLLLNSGLPYDSNGNILRTPGGGPVFRDIAPEALGHISEFSMGCDIADFNNDGLPDILTLDMLPEDNRRQKLLQGPENYEVYEMMVKTGRHHQYMRNMLHLNSGPRWTQLIAQNESIPLPPGLEPPTKKLRSGYKRPHTLLQSAAFQEIGQLAGISNTDWSWSALFADFDNDGWKDIFITNGYLRDYTNRDFLRYWGDYLIKKAAAAETPSLLELVQKMPASKIKNYLFRNNGDLTFSNMTDTWGLSQPAVSNGAVYADLDLDGDLEIVVNNINEPAFIYKNKARETNKNNYIQFQIVGKQQNTKAIGTKIRLRDGSGKMPLVELVPTRGYQSSVPEVVHFGLGKSGVPYVEISFPDESGAWATISGRDVTMNRLNVLDLEKLVRYPRVGAVPAWEVRNEPLPGTGSWPDKMPRHREYDYNDFKRQPLLPYMLSHCGPAMAATDLDGDGGDDLFFGGSKWNAGNIYFQRQHLNMEAGADSMVFKADQFCTDADALFFDADKDGDADLYVVSGGYSDYRDDGDPNLDDRLYVNDGKGRFSKKEDALPAMPFSKSCARAADYDGDGDQDLFVGGRVIPGYFPIAPPSYLLQNDGSGRFARVQIPGLPERPGMVTDAAWADLNNDRRPDLILCGEWMPIRIFHNTPAGFEEHTRDYFDRPYSGLWNRLLVQDLDGDGDQDIVGGNFGLNSQIKASDGEPATLVYKDFDSNGSVDPILCFYNQGKSYPFLTRDELLDQITAMRPRFTSYEQFAGAALSDIFTPAELQGADTLRVNCLESMFFQNTGGRFTAKTLPIAAQMTPVHVIVAWDKRLLLFGNQSAARLRLGRMDAGTGVLLYLENGKEYMEEKNPNVSVSGDARSAVRIKTLGQENELGLTDIFVIGVNNAPAACFGLWKR